MFGIIRPCRNRLGSELKAAWLSHLCGMCLSLRDEHGHLARLVTNYDGLMISALVEAQAGRSTRKAGPCALRGLRSADVSIGDGARLAASTSLILASLKLRDHVDDGDGLAGRFGWAGRRLASRWAEQGSSASSDLGVDTAVMVAAVSRQASVEALAGLGSSVLLVTAPTEEATAYAVSRTAVLAGRPGNEAPLREVGRLFGRVAHLLDAVEDLSSDQASGSYNPLVATGTSIDEARRLCDDAAVGIRLALKEVEFSDSRLVHKLLAHEVDEAIIRVFGGRAKDHTWSDPGSGLWAWPQLHNQPQPRGCFAGCGAFLYMCGTCQFCCRDPFPGPWSDKRRENACDCDCDGCDCCCKDCSDCDCSCCPCD
ncbi:hypothetical protein Lesp02_16590 [Lentzea sp. NBRC 105346]|uniref:DUF5685 family protein n=1 Tax=Lentzea sp. NBRC 105346 TaxID=3032205 RepID=UPI0024A5244F|nr:DUF5685 family protein [Lentzea sp. NBRC 105346]GLZ29469.1 hypothetical protein Lesp02_16590 [Lentzea sp. NBRC 105346]